jgi:hypothetical protein
MIYSQTSDRIYYDWIVNQPSVVPNTDAESWTVTTDKDGYLYWGINKIKRIGGGFDISVIRLDRNNPMIFQEVYRYDADFNQQLYILHSRDPLLFAGGRNCRSNDINLKDCDGFITVLDLPVVKELWSRTIDRGVGYEEVDGVDADDSAIYVSGWSVSDTSDIDAFIRCYDHSGNERWTTYYGTKNTDHADGHLVIDNEYVYICGVWDGIPNPLFIGFSGFDGRAYAAKFRRSDGSLVARTLLGNRDTTYTNFENALGMTSDDRYLYITGVTTVKKNDNQIFIAKIEKKNMIAIWYRVWGGDSTDAARAITIDDSGYIWVGGLTNSFSADYEGVMLKYSPGGDLVYHGFIGGELKDEIRELIFDRGKLFAAATFTDPISGNSQGILMQIDPRNTPAAVTSLTIDVPRVSPNPLTTSALIWYNNQQSIEPLTLTISDVLGRIVRIDDRIFDSPYIFERQNLPSGIYQYILSTGKTILGKGSLIIE